MTDNNTVTNTAQEQHHRPIAEQLTDAQKQQLLRLKKAIDKLHVEFTDDHFKTIINPPIGITEIMPSFVSDDNGESNARAEVLHPLISPTEQARIKRYIAIIKAFKKEYDSIIEAYRQAAIFEEDASPHLTVAQKRAWSNYGEISPKCRLFWLLIVGAHIISAQEMIGAVLDSATADTDRIDSFVATKRKYLRLLQAKPINDISKMTERHKKEVEDKAAGAILSIYRLKPGEEETELTIKLLADENLNRRLLTLAPSTKYFLFFILVQFTHQNKYWHLTEKNAKQLELFTPTLTIRAPLEHYAQLRKRKTNEESLKKFRAEVVADIERLRAITLKGKWGAGRNSAIKIYGLINGGAVSRNMITVDIDKDFARQLITAYVTILPRAIWELDPRRPSLFPIALTLCLHYSMYSNVERGTNNIISLTSLLNACGRDLNTDHKTELYQAIDADLEVLVDIGILESYVYHNSGGTPLSDTQLDTLVNNPREIADGIYIKYTLKDYPIQAQEERIKAYNKRRQQQKKASENAAKRKTSTVRA